MIPVTGEIYNEVQLDGIYCAELCCLIAVANSKVIAWQWCDTEKAIAWETLMGLLPSPVVVVCDGGPGFAKARKALWPDTRVQRCLVHVVRNTKTDLTTHPRTDAGQALLALGRALTRIDTIDKAVEWETRLNEWHQAYGSLVEEKTYAGRNVVRPIWAPMGRSWWFTHEHLRRAYLRLARLVKEGVLFTYLDPELATIDVNSSTNQIEGGVNAQLRAMLFTHRGLTPERQRRAVEWWCYLHSERPVRPSMLVTRGHWQQTTPPTIEENELTAPQAFENTAVLTVNTYDGDNLWQHKGWGGRNH